jgi:hypothetical protein
MGNSYHSSDGRLALKNSRIGVDEITGKIPGFKVSVYTEYLGINT